MPAISETILDETTHPAGNAELTVTGDAYKGDGYYGRSDGFHTVQMTFENFVGTVKIQATLATEPTANDWFDVTDVEHVSPNASHANADGSFFYNFTGNFVWIRTKVVYTGGSVNSIKLNH